MKLINTISAVLAVYFITGCSESVELRGMNGFASSTSISEDQYGEIRGIPQRASDRRSQAFDEFIQRSKIADYLLNEELEHDLNLQVELQEIVNQKTIEVYFDTFLESALSESALKIYYDDHSGEYSKKNYELTRIVFRAKNEQGELDIAAEEFREVLAEKGDKAAIELLNKFSSVSVSTQTGVELYEENIDVKLLSELERLGKGDVSYPIWIGKTLQVFRLDSFSKIPLPYEDVAARVKYDLSAELRRKEIQRLSLLSKAE
ncbi:peptidyl-prolyl cis-trans isomerase [Microbulbifer sp. JMSA003]|uniref:peptidyl-prolyl cis-trans isomerase n=1 Tax=Microbulbifer sp. JMSA003 TaxID=3243369 RepID=UPI0040397A55